mmetsp:Transcript_84036/g.251921  ORF Transcript_84036/g.251921 Transcript_84036/m.251921 type:complete len:290 (-) Transcript_84036:599-1468(-)
MGDARGRRAHIQRRCTCMRRGGVSDAGATLRRAVRARCLRRGRRCRHARRGATHTLAAGGERRLARLAAACGRSAAAALPRAAHGRGAHADIARGEGAAQEAAAEGRGLDSGRRRGRGCVAYGGPSRDAGHRARGAGDRACCQGHRGGRARRARRAHAHASGSVRRRARGHLPRGGLVPADAAAPRHGPLRRRRAGLHARRARPRAPRRPHNERARVRLHAPALLYRHGVRPPARDLRHAPARRAAGVHRRHGLRRRPAAAHAVRVRARAHGARRCTRHVAAHDGGRRL